MKDMRRTIAFVMIIAILGINLIKQDISIYNNYSIKANEIVEESGENITSNIEEITSSVIQEDITTFDEITSEDISFEDSSTEESTSIEESSSIEESTSIEETTIPEETTTEFIIIDEVYKVKDGVLVEYLGNKKDKSITTLDIPSEIEAISDNVFYKCKYVETINFKPESNIKRFGEFVFKSCLALTKVNLPEGIEDLGYRAFAQCSNLEKLVIPSSVIKGRQLVGKEGSIKEVEFKKGNKSVPTSILRYAHTLEKVKMYSGVESIGNNAFYGCEKLSTVNLPDSIKKIGNYSFYGCKSITKLTLPSSLKSIGNYAFKNCELLKKLKLKKTITFIGTGAFDGIPDFIMQVYANSCGKGYAIKNNIKWEYTASELKRLEKVEDVRKKFELQISRTDKPKYKLKQLTNYIPQGVCTIKNYLVVSMYHRTLSKKSILLIYNKNTGKYIKKLYLPSVDHVGAVTNIKNRLVVSLNNISATDYVAVINYKKLKTTKNNKTLKYNYKVKLAGYADFANYDGTYFWAGRSANISYASMYGYKVKVKKKKLTFAKKYSFTVPANTQGVEVIKGKGANRTFILSQSYGVTANSKIYIHNININKNTSLGDPKSVKLAPSMIEGIVKSGSNFYMVFESAAKKYCSDENYTTEVQVKNVIKIKYKNLEYLYEE